MPDKPTVLLITSSYPSSPEDPMAAAGMFVKDFAGELSRIAHVEVLSPRVSNASGGCGAPDPPEPKVTLFRWAGTGRPLSTLRLPGDLRLIVSVLTRGAWTSIKAARSGRPDAVMALWAVPSGIWALLLKTLFGVPYIVWCLGSDVWDYGSRPIFRWLVRLILRQSAALFADGQQLKADVEAISGRQCEFLPSTRRLDTRRTSIVPLKEGKKNFLFIGRYHRNKGPDILLQAVRRLSPETREKVHFYLFGGGPLGEELRREIEALGLSDVVDLGGYIGQPEAVAYLKGCNALVIPSRIESIPVVLSDALQADCPVLVADVGDMGRLVKQYRAGIVFTPVDPDSLARAITAACDQEVDYSAGRRELLQVFSLERCVDRVRATVSRLSGV